LSQCSGYQGDKNFKGIRISQIPPDLVVKYQGIDFVGVIL
jgi:hypothetical protein